MVDARIRKLDSIKPQSRTDEKLRTLLSDLSRFEVQRYDPSKIPSAKFTDTSGQAWDIASESFMGIKRPFSSNSDRCTDIKNRTNPILMAAVADGVSGHSVDQNFSAGQKAAKAVIEHLESGLDFNRTVELKPIKIKAEQLKTLTIREYLSQTIDNSKAHWDADLQKIEKLLKANITKLLLPNIGSYLKLTEAYLALHNAKLNPHKDGFERIDPSKEFSNGFNPGKYIRYRLSLMRLGSEALLTKILEQDALKFFSELNSNNISGKLLIEKLPLAINVIKALAQAEDKIADKFNSSTSIRRLTDNIYLKPGTTITMSLDAGDKIMLVSAGDPIAFAYKDGQIVKDSINDPHLAPFEGISSMISASRGDHETGFRKEFKADNKFKVSVKLVDKKYIDGILLASDGMFLNHPRHQDDNAIQFNLKNNDVRTILAAALNRASAEDFAGGKHDDKSVTILQKTMAA